MLKQFSHKLQASFPSQRHFSKNLIPDKIADASQLFSSC